MLRKLKHMMEKWGHYFLALLCAGVILLSALWTRTRQEEEMRNARVLSDQSQRLADVTQAPSGLVRPVPGEILDGMHETPVFYPRLSLWYTHPGIDFAATPGEKILCMADGVITQTEKMIEITRENGDIFRYFGVKESLVSTGESVRAGDEIGIAGERVHMEKDADRICVVLIRENKTVDFIAELSGQEPED